MLQIVGSNGNAQQEGVIQLPVEDALQIFEGRSIQHTPLAANELGLFSLQSAGNKGLIRWGSFTNIKHVLTSRSKGCTMGKVKGQMNLNTYEDKLESVEFNGKICQDQFWGTAFERLYGVGMDMGSLLATPEGKKLFQIMMDKIFGAIGESMWALASFGQNPLIAKAAAANTFKENPKDWANFTDQMEVLAGYYTQCDYQKSIGSKNYNVEFRDGIEVDAAGNFIGNPRTFFQRVVDSSTNIMKVEIDRTVKGLKPPILVSKEIFDSYKTLLENTFTAIPESYYLVTQGLDGVKQIQRNILFWEGHPVIYDHENQTFDNIIGMKTHRVMLATPGVIGIGYDIESLAGQYNGMGLVIQDMGNWDIEQMDLIKMRTRFKMVTRILDIDFVTYGSRTFIKKLDE